MLGNTFGRVFRITTAGESYGEGLACIIDGVPPGIPLSESMIQAELDKRKPGQSPLDSPRMETDIVKILSGVMEGYTTGAPVCLIVHNVDRHEIHVEQYRQVKDLIRPGHAEYTFFVKYGKYADWCGAGRASGRETVGRVAGGAVAKQILKRDNIEVIAYVSECLGIKAKPMTFEEVKANYRKNDLNCPDLDAAKAMIDAVLKIKDEGDTAGGAVTILVRGVPPGLGEPVFDKLQATIAYGLMGIGAIKGVEIGAGFDVTKMKGSEFNDHPFVENGKVRFKTNRAGGFLGGISTGEEIVIRAAIKPTPTLSIAQPSVNMAKMKDETLAAITRRDPTLLGRWYPVAEAMVSCAVLDSLYMWEGYKSLSKLEDNFYNT